MQNILIIGEQLLEEMEEYLESGELRDGLLTDVENYFKEYTIENVLNYIMDKISPEVTELHKR